MDPATLLRLHLLGAPRLLKLENGDVTRVRLQPRRLALLALVAVESREGTVRRDRLVGTLWPDRSPRRARRALSQALYGLRRAVGSETLPGRGDEEVGLDRRRLWCDVIEFRGLLEVDDPDAALELYRGDFLEGFYISGSPDFERWADSVRHDLRRRARQAALELAERERGEGRLASAARWLQRSLEIDPTRERPLRQLMRVLGESGERIGALQAFSEQRRRMDREFGLEPDPETLELAEAIRRGEFSFEVADEPSARADSKEARSAHRFPTKPTGPGWDRPSVAVLPFDERDLDPDRRFLSTALARGISSRLAEFGDLAVTSADAIREAKHTTLPPPDLASRLGVEYLVFGGLGSREGGFDVSVRMVDGRSNTIIWRDDLQCDPAGLLEIQEAIATGIAERLGAEASRSTETPGHRVASPGAYQLHLRARELMFAGAREHATAVELLNQSVRLDPKFAPAYAALGEAVGMGIQYFGYDRDHVESGLVAARRALDLDPDLPDGHAALALNLHHLGRLSAARDTFERAIELRPNFARAMSHLSFTELQAGRFDEASRWARRGLPLLPGDPEIRVKIAAADFLLMRFSQAESWLERAVECRPGYPLALAAFVYMELIGGAPERALERARVLLDHDRESVLGLRSMGDAALYAGHVDLARSCFDRLYQLAPESRHPTTFITTRLMAAYCAHVGGEGERANTLLDVAMRRATEELERGHEHPGIPLERAAVRAIREEREAALEWLSRAVDAGWNTPGLTEYDPLFEGVRSDRRFTRLMSKMKDRVAKMRDGIKREVERSEAPGRTRADR